MLQQIKQTEKRRFEESQKKQYDCLLRSHMLKSRIEKLKQDGVLVPASLEEYKQYVFALIDYECSINRLNIVEGLYHLEVFKVTKNADVPTDKLRGSRALTLLYPMHVAIPENLGHCEVIREDGFARGYRFDCLGEWLDEYGRSKGFNFRWQHE